MVTPPHVADRLLDHVENNPDYKFAIWVEHNRCIGNNYNSKLFNDWDVMCGLYLVSVSSTDPSVINMYIIPPDEMIAEIQQIQPRGICGWNRG